MKIESIFSEVLLVPEANINDSTQLKDIVSWDSMTHMILITRLEEEYGIQLTGDEIADMHTMGDARRFLSGHGASV